MTERSSYDEPFEYEFGGEKEDVKSPDADDYDDPRNVEGYGDGAEDKG